MGMYQSSLRQIDYTQQVGLPTAEIDDIFMGDNEFKYNGDDQDFADGYDTTSGQYFWRLPTVVAPNEPIINIFNGVIGETVTTPAAGVLANTENTIVIWGGTGAVASYTYIQGGIGVTSGTNRFRALTNSLGVDIDINVVSPVIDIGADVLASGVFIDIGYDTAETSDGTLTIFRFTNAQALTLGADILGVDLDLATNVTVATDQDITAYNTTLPAITQSAANTTTYIGYQIDTAGALVQDTAAGTLNWYGVNLVAPQSTISFAASAITTTMIRVATAGALASSTAGTHQWFCTDLALPASTATGTATTNIAGLRIATVGAVEINTGAATTSWRGTQILVPDVTQTTGTITAYGHESTLGDITTGGTVAGYNLITPAKTNSTANTLTFRGFYTSSVGALIQDTAAGILNWYGFDLTAPASTLSFAAGTTSMTMIRLLTTNPVASSTAGTQNWYIADVRTPTVTATGTATTNVAGFRLSLAGAITQDTAAGTVNWYGTDFVTPIATTDTALVATINIVGHRLATAGALVSTAVGNVLNWTGQEIQMPNITQTAGTLTTVGLDIDAGTVTTGGTVTGINIAMAGAYTTANEIAMIITGDARTLQILTTDGHIVAPNEDLLIQGNAASSVYDVTFFENQTDPGTGAMAAGEVPEIRFYGWDHAGTTLRANVISTISVGEGANPDDDEISYLKIGVADAGSRNVVIADEGDDPEFIAVSADPSLFIYNSAITGWLRISAGVIFGNAGVQIRASADEDDYISFTTNTNVPGFTTIGDTDMAIQNQAAANPFDVTFFNAQTVPAATPAAGSTPQLRIYGWSSATLNTQVYSTIMTSALEEGVVETGNEIAVMRIQPANRTLIISDINEIIEITSANSNPTLLIYDAGGTDYLFIYDDDSYSYLATNPNPLRFTHGSNSAQLQNYVCGFATEPTLSGGAVLGFTGVTGTTWAAGNYAGGNATKGSWLFNNATDEILFSLPLPELFVDTGVAGEFILGLTYTTTNGTDRFDYAIYDEDGTVLIDEVDQTLGATSGTYTINLGALAIAKGDSIVVALIGFETTAPADTTATITDVELTYEVGIENNVA